MNLLPKPKRHSGRSNLAGAFVGVMIAIVAAVYFSIKTISHSINYSVDSYTSYLFSLNAKLRFPNDWVPPANHSLGPNECVALLNSSYSLTNSKPPWLIGLSANNLQSGSNQGSENVVTISNELDSYTAQLPLGNIAYQTPKRIFLASDETNNIAVLRLSPKQDLKVLIGLLDTNVSQNLQLARVKIAPRMRATLDSDKDSDALKIVPLNEVIQPVSFNDDTVWSWRIVAKKKDVYWLHLKLEILMQIDGEDIYHPVVSYESYVSVDATVWSRLGEFWGENWQYIITTVVAILAIMVPIYVKLRKKKTLVAPVEAKTPAAPAEAKMPAAPIETKPIVAPLAAPAEPKPAEPKPAPPTEPKPTTPAETTTSSAPVETKPITPESK